MMSEDQVRKLMEAVIRMEGRLDSIDARITVIAKGDLPQCVEHRLKIEQLLNNGKKQDKGGTSSFRLSLKDGVQLVGIPYDQVGVALRVSLVIAVAYLVGKDIIGAWVSWVK